MYGIRKLSEQETALKIEREYENASRWNSKNFKRCVDNWRMYWGNDGEKGFGQWPADAAAELNRQGRHVATFNICRPTLDNIAGGIVKAPFGFTFSPVDTEISSLTYKISDIQYNEWELMDVRSHELEMVLGGLTYQATMEMYLSDEYSPKDNRNLKNIGLRTLSPGSIMYDPNWRSPRSKDCKKAWKESWLSPLQMLELYSEKRNQIIQAVMYKQFGMEYIKNFAHIQFDMGDEYGGNIGIIPYAENEEMWGSLYKVIEYYHMEKMKVKCEYVLTEDGGKVRIPGYLKDVEQKIKWLNDNFPGWIPDQIFEEEEYEWVQLISTICPSLQHGLLLQNGLTEIQCGRLQFFPWSAYRANGEFGGIIDAIKDLQMQINNLESMLTYKLQIEGGGGAQFVWPEMFFNYQECEKYVRNRNNPDAVFRMKNGSWQKLGGAAPATPVRKSPYPAEAMERLTHLIEIMLPKISKVSPASRGETESSGESGYLFKLKKMQSDIEQYTIYESLRNFWNEVGEAYLYQAITTHGNGIERTFYSAQEKKTFKINERKTIEDEFGNSVDVIVDNIAMLKDIRHRVNVVESEESPTRKMEVIQAASELRGTVDVNANPLLANKLTYAIVKNIDVFDPDTKKELESMEQQESEAAEQALAAKKANDKLVEYNAMAQMNQAPGVTQAGGPVANQQSTQPQSPSSPTPEQNQQQFQPMEMSVAA